MLHRKRLGVGAKAEMTHSQRTTLEPGSRTEPHPPTNSNRQCQSMPSPFSMPMQARVKIQEAATISSDIDIEVTLSTFQPLKLQPGSPAGQGQPPKLLQRPASRLRHDGGWLGRIDLMVEGDFTLL
ncbi:hypothetical protein WAI453_002844 [Rhynchosporium graminicola]